MYKPTSSSIVRQTLTALAGLSLLSAATAGTTSSKAPVGKETIPPPAAPSPWDVTAAFGLGLAKGNTDSLSLNAAILATYLEGSNEFYLGADYLYGENNGAQTSNAFSAYAAYNRLLTDRLYLGLGGDFRKDDQSGLDYRFSLTPSLGYYLIKNDTTKLAFEAGAGYAWEDQGGLSRDYWTARVAQRFEHKLSARSKIWESIVYSPEFDDFDNYLLVAEAGLTVKLTDNLALRTSVRDTYDSTPSAGSDKNDLAVLAGIQWSAAGIKDDAAPAGRATLKAKKAAAAAVAMGWSNSAALGFGLTRGNSETLSLAADYAGVYRSATNEFFLGLGGSYGEVGSTTNAQNIRASVQHNWLLSDVLFAGLGANFLYDDIAAVDYRFTPAATIGAYLVKNDSVALSLEAGPGFTFEKVGGVSDEYFSVYAAQKLSVQICEGVKLGEQVSFTTEAADWNNYSIVATAFIEADLTEDLALRVGVTDLYDATPAAGRDSNDIMLTSGIAVQF